MTVSWREMTAVFGRIGVLSFGGPAAQIALMHRVLVDEKGWLDEDDYLRALSFCMLLPGPEAMQLATYAGWRLRGAPGGFLAGLLFVLPGAALILALAAAYVAWGNLPWVVAVFHGVKAAVVVIVLDALLRVARRSLKTGTARILAGLAFLALAIFGVPFPLVVLAAGVAGAVLLPIARHGQPAPKRAAAGRFPLLLIAGLALAWVLPLVLAWGTGAQLLLEVGLFFSKLAVVTFGGAYAVLAWMAQTVSADMGWLSRGAMMDALALAETTPGPLILVTEFVAYLAGSAKGAGVAVLAAAMALWVTFVPCFLWVFAGAPYLATLTARPRLGGALAGVSAAVVGVIASLGLWFAAQAFFAASVPLAIGPMALDLPVPASFDAISGLIAVASGLVLLRWHWPLPLVLCLAGLIGFALPA